MGLVKGIDGFDLSHGCKFTTYIYPYIFKSCAQEMEVNEAVLRFTRGSYYTQRDEVSYINLNDSVNGGRNKWLDILKSDDADSIVDDKINTYYNKKFFDKQLNKLSDTDVKIMKLYFDYDNNGIKFTLGEL